MNGYQILTVRQTQRLFTEHFAHRLLCAHGLEESFECPADPTPATLAQCVCAVIGINGGTVPGTMAHACTECSHQKQYWADLQTEGVSMSEARAISTLVAGEETDMSSGVCTSFMETI
jgi:hypothetical protein